MADDTPSIDESDQLKARRDRMSGGRSGGGSRFFAVLFFIILLLFAAVFVVFPDQARQLLGLGTSSSEDIQETSRVDNSGISTQIQREPEINVETPENIPVIETPDTGPTTAELDPEAKARLDALERALADIANRPQAEGAPTADDIKKLLDQQAAGLKADAEAREQLIKAQIDALRAQVQLPKGPTAEELAEQERLQREAEERERLRKLLEERRAAREAELLKRRVSDGNVYDESEEGKSTSGAQDETGVRELSDNEQFLKSAASQGWETARASDLEDVSRTIVQGTIITAVLETAINTELPGNIQAQVMTPVFSYDGQNILMPKGTKLIGTYNPKISIAQKRVLIAWNRAITPEGKTVALAGTGVDRLGRGGQEGNVDTRFFQRFGTAVLITSIAAIPSFLANDDTSGNTGASAANDVAQDVSDDLKDATEDVLEEYLSLPPIIRVPQGTLMNVLVNQDLVFS